MALHLTNFQKNELLYFGEEESHHMTRSLRKQSGDAIMATDGAGTIFSAAIVSINKGMVTAAVSHQYFQPRDWKVHVACSLIKKDNRFEYFLEKATETGIHRITPLVCGRTIKANFRQDRALKIIKSAVQQSFNPYVPILDPVTSLEEFLKKNGPSEADRFIATSVDRVEVPLLEQQYSGKNAVTILIGPEGDFTPQELENAMGTGWQPVSLGQNRLRTETAATMAVQIIKSCYHIKSQTTQ